MPQLLRLLDRAWESGVASMGTTTPGIIGSIFVVVGVVAISTFLHGKKKYRQWSWRAIGDGLGESVRPGLVTAGVTCLFWMVVFGWFLTKTVYLDHNDLAASIRSLREGKKAIEAERDVWKAKALTPIADSTQVVLLYEGKPLEGRVIDVADGQLFGVGEFQARNTGNEATSTPLIQARLYFSESAGNATPSIWRQTTSDEEMYPFALYWATQASISPQETFNIPEFFNNGGPIEHQIRMRLKVFFGGDRPAIASFTVRPISNR